MNETETPPTLFRQRLIERVLKSCQFDGFKKWTVYGKLFWNRRLNAHFSMLPKSKLVDLLSALWNCLCHLNFVFTSLSALQSLTSSTIWSVLFAINPHCVDVSLNLNVTQSDSSRNSRYSNFLASLEITEIYSELGKVYQVVISLNFLLLTFGNEKYLLNLNIEKSILLEGITTRRNYIILSTKQRYISRL